MIKRVVLLVVCSIIALMTFGCWGEVEHSMSGATMGTTYHIKVAAGRFKKMDPVQKRIDALLAEINHSMSTYQPDSEISRFNGFGEVETPFPVSAHFLRVMLTAREIYTLTGGAWDGTVNPLVNLWGFGKDGDLKELPSDAAIDRALTDVGFDNIEVDVSGHLKKRIAGVTIDLASIAKGYGVDQVALLLRSMSFDRFLVEIGGEVYAAGRRPNGKQWRVGINQPDKGSPVDAVYEAVPLENQAMATSGDYRIFYEVHGRTYAHIIDPRTGRPIRNGVVSASVIADNCALADGLATAMMVMGPREGIALLDALPGVWGLIVVRHGDGRLENFWSASDASSAQ